MQKWRFATALLLMLVLIYFYSNNQSQKTDVIAVSSEPIKPIQTPVSKDSIAKKIKTKTIALPKKKDWLEGYDKSKDHTPRVDLITAFREFRKVKRSDML